VIVFLSVENVLQIHEDTIAIEGGLRGIRDLGLLESAVAMPRQQFGGDYLHDGVAAMAAAYLFHIASNHPFVDGNKRAAVLAALVFLDINRIDPLPDPDEMETATLDVARGALDKAALTRWFRERVPDVQP
jgi:death-on-curing protein